MAQKRVLGRGLGALIPARPAAEEARGVILVSIDQVAPNPYQPRKEFHAEGLAELVESIRLQGVLQPVLVRRSSSGYELIAGERRLRAARLAGLTEIPALVKDGGREESLVWAVVENIQREDLNPIEAALAYRTLIEEFALNQEAVAKAVGKDRASVANYLRLLNLPQAIQEDVAAARISMGHARALLSLPDRALQLTARDRILGQDLSVRDTERLVSTLVKGRKKAIPQRSASDPHRNAVQEDLKRRLGTKVQISARRRGGIIRIYYHSADELERITAYLLSER